MHATCEVRLGNQNQINAGILANVIIHLWNEQQTEVLFSLEEFCIRNSANGPFLAPPSRPYEYQGQRKYKKIVKIAPNEPFDKQDGYRARVEQFVFAEYERLRNGGQPAPSPIQRQEPTTQAAPPMQQQVPPQAPPPQAPVSNVPPAQPYQQPPAPPAPAQPQPTQPAGDQPLW